MLYVDSTMLPPPPLGNLPYPFPDIGQFEFSVGQIPIQGPKPQLLTLGVSSIVYITLEIMQSKIMHADWFKTLFLFNNYIMSLASFKSKVWKDFGFKVFYDTQWVSNIVKENVICRHCFSELQYTGSMTNISFHVQRHHPSSGLKRVQVLKPPPQVSQKLVHLNCLS